MFSICFGSPKFYLPHFLFMVPRNCNGIFLILCVSEVIFFSILLKNLLVTYMLRPWSSQYPSVKQHFPFPQVSSSSITKLCVISWHIGALMLYSISALLGKQFASSPFTWLINFLCINRIRTKTYNSEANKMIKHFYRSLK